MIKSSCHLSYIIFIEYLLKMYPFNILCFSAVEGCSHVLHIASPFPVNQPKDADEVVRPAVEGTLNVLKACKEAGTVKRVTLTSSIASVGSKYKLLLQPFYLRCNFIPYINLRW